MKTERKELVTALPEKPPANSKKFKRCKWCKGPQHFGVCKYPDDTFKGMTYGQIEDYANKNPR